MYIAVEACLPRFRISTDVVSLFVSQGSCLATDLYAVILLRSWKLFWALRRTYQFHGEPVTIIFKRDEQLHVLAEGGRGITLKCHTDYR
jgi:hypothetical protein